jgi:hypothetical protein
VLRRTAGQIFVFTAVFFSVGRAAWSRAAPQNEIRVTLFGQPCLLSGPVDEASLKLIHSVSPEQMPSARTGNYSAEQARKALERLRKVAGLPSALDRYRERLTKRLEAELAFDEGYEAALKSHQISAWVAGARKYLNEAKLHSFESLAKKAEALKTLDSDRGRELTDQLFELYAEGIEPDPEEEFHRAIKRMNVQYACSFEESSDESGGEGSD